jgi:hypothetical protein
MGKIAKIFAGILLVPGDKKLFKTASYASLRAYKSMYGARRKKYTFSIKIVIFTAKSHSTLIRFILFTPIAVISQFE